MELLLDTYALSNAEDVLTPALLIYPDVVQGNIKASLDLMGGDAQRWRPHIKTVKSPDVIRALIRNGVGAFKCATTLELRMCCEEKAQDVLFAMPATGRTVRRVAEIAQEFKPTRVSVLVESEEQLQSALREGLEVFIDINPGMNRTGILPERPDQIRSMAQKAGGRFRGLHFYDGHVSATDPQQTSEGYVKLLALVDSMTQPVRELITSGTPAAVAGLRFPGFQGAPFQHRVSPGTIVFSDLNSLGQLPGMGFAPAVVVLATVVSHPAPGIITCDAGHKSVSVDSGVPNCSAVGHPELEALKPSEEHLPMRVPNGVAVPAIGEHLYLVPKHVCPTVNMFDEGLAVRHGSVEGHWPIRARGHEPALP